MLKYNYMYIIIRLAVLIDTLIFFVVKTYLLVNTTTAIAPMIKNSNIRNLSATVFYRIRNVGLGWNLSEVRRRRAERSQL